MAKLIELVESKKFKIYAAACLSLLASDSEPGLLVLAEITVKGLIALTLGYLTAQGVADHGKETEKVRVADQEKIRAKNS